jgi:nitronate monooxygenase
VNIPLVVQAPMGSNQPASLAAAVTRAGGLGGIPGAGVTVDELREGIREVRAATDGPFNVNLFAAPYHSEDALTVVLEERPAVFSFTFGIIDPAPFREAGITTFGTATSAEEAVALEAAGVDVVVAQGAEAGGHRGSFLDGFPLVPLAELVPAVVDAVGVPVIAAGGIVDRHDVRAALELDATAVQVGTAFLFTRECARPREHLEALKTYETVVTDAYTGRQMRAARDPVLEDLMQVPPVPFPEQRAVSAERGPVYMGGTGGRRAREQSVAELVAELRAGEAPAG